jgi:hypothetical protein
MKKTILLFLVALSATLLFAQPHPVYIEVWDCDGVQIPAGDVFYTAKILERPNEVIDINSFEWEYGGVVPGYLSGNVANGFSTWAPGETLEIALTQLSTGYEVSNSWILTSGYYEYHPNPGGVELSLSDDCVVEQGNIDWGNGVTGNVTGGIPSNPGYGYGTGLPNEDLLANPDNIEHYFTLTIDSSTNADITLSIDLEAFDYMPYNLAYWHYNDWIYLPSIDCPIDWMYSGYYNITTTFTIGPTLREDVNIPIVLRSYEPILTPYLPIFTVSGQGNNILIRWESIYDPCDEVGLSYYRVYRDGIEIAHLEAENDPNHNYEVTDCPEFNGTYYYSLEAVRFDGTAQYWVHTPVEFVLVIPEVTQLGNNFPNPFNPTTNIKFTLAEDSDVNITVFNSKGQKVKTLTDQNYDSGFHQVIWSGLDYAGEQVDSGVYFYKMNMNGKERDTKKMMLIK